MANDCSLSWDLDSLNKAYRQGYMAGVMGMDRSKCPYSDEIIQNAWEGGWEDGAELCELEKPISKIAS